MMTKTELLAWLLGKVKDGIGRIWASFAALLASPAVWVAVAVVFVGGFWVGHIEGAAGKRALAADVKRISAALNEQNDNLSVAAARIAKAEGEAALWKAKAEAAGAETARVSGAAAGQGEAVAGETKKPVLRLRKKTTPASEAPTGFWPFKL